MVRIPDFEKELSTIWPVHTVESDALSPFPLEAIDPGRVMRSLRGFLNHWASIPWSSGSVANRHSPERSFNESSSPERHPPESRRARAIKTREIFIIVKKRIVMVSAIQVMFPETRADHPGQHSLKWELIIVISGTLDLSTLRGDGICFRQPSGSPVSGFPKLRVR